MRDRAQPRDVGAVGARSGLGGSLGDWGAGRAHKATARGFWRSGAKSVNCRRWRTAAQRRGYVREERALRLVGRLGRKKRTQGNGEEFLAKRGKTANV